MLEHGITFGFNWTLTLTSENEIDLSMISITDVGKAGQEGLEGGKKIVDRIRFCQEIFIFNFWFLRRASSSFLRVWVNRKLHRHLLSFIVDQPSAWKKIVSVGWGVAIKSFHMASLIDWQETKQNVSKFVNRNCKLFTSFQVALLQRKLFTIENF